MILIIGRFQPLHNGHARIIRHAYSEDKKLVIVIGSSNKQEEIDNPFTEKERERMIKAFLAKENIDAKIIGVPDIPEDEEYVDLVNKKAGVPDKIVTGNKWTEQLYREKGFAIETTERYDNISATDIRNAMATGKEWKGKVPEEVAEVIMDIDGERRVRQLFAGFNRC